MCKIFGLTNASILDEKKLAKLITTVGTAFALTEKDGFGWAGWNGQGISYEQYVSPYFFNGPYVLGASIAPLNKLERNLMWVPSFRSVFPKDAVTGKPCPITGPLIIHGRTSTNDVNITNTHPFIKAGYALVHNGVVEYTGPGHLRYSTCDSEFLLNEFVFEQGPSDFHKHITGYYAVLAIGPDGKLHVVRDNMAYLWGAQVLGTSCWIFCTTPTILKQAADAAELKISIPFPVMPHSYGVFNASGLESVRTIQPCPEAQIDQRLVAKSIGEAQAEADEETEDTEASRRRSRNRDRNRRRRRNRKVKESVQ